MTTIFASAAFIAVCILSLSTTGLGRKAASAPALLLFVGGALSLLYRAIDMPVLQANTVSVFAQAGLAALAFASAAQFRISTLSQKCPTAFRLTLGGAPLFLLTCGLSAYILLPQLNFESALLLGAALMLNGAAFDRRAVTRAPAPAQIKAAVRLESAAIIALGAPIAIFLAANATAAAANEPSAAPLFDASLAAFKGFALGGAAGLLIAKVGNRLAQRARSRPRSGMIIAIGATAVYCLSGLAGADPVIAALAAGLLWGEETKSPDATRLRLRSVIEHAVAPITYFAFGALFAPRILQADLLSIVFALAAVTVMRAAPRLAILQTKELAKECQVFLAWFGGAPGAASALFLMMLFGNAALTNQEGVLTVGALAVSAGILAARMTSKPLAKAYLRERVRASKRRMFAG